MTEDKAQQAYWIGQVYVLDGKCWGRDLRRKVDKKGISYLDVVNVCLGNEEDIVPILKGESPLGNLPDDADGYKRIVLRRILDEDEVEYVRSDIAERSVERGRAAKPLGDRERNTGLPQRTKGLSHSASRTR